MSEVPLYRGCNLTNPRPRRRMVLESLNGLGDYSKKAAGGNGARGFGNGAGNGARAFLEPFVADAR